MTLDESTYRLLNREAEAAVNRIKTNTELKTDRILLALLTTLENTTCDIIALISELKKVEGQL